MNYWKDFKEGDSKTRLGYIGVILGFVLMGLIVFWLVYPASQGEVPSIEVFTSSKEDLNDHVRVYTHPSLDSDSLKEPYILTVLWDFPEGSYLTPNEILNEEYYEEGFSLFLRRLISCPKEKWASGYSERCVEIFKDRDGIVSLSYDDLKVGQVNREYRFKTEKEMLQFKKHIESKEAWKSLLREYVEYYNEEKERRFNIWKDKSKYPTRENEVKE